MNRIEIDGIKVNDGKRPNFWDRMHGNGSKKNGRDEEGLMVTQRSFVEYFMVSGEATTAYKKCAEDHNLDLHEGMEDQDRFIKMRAYQMMVNPRVKAAIDKRRKHFQEKMEISEERVLQEYAYIAFAKLTDYYTVEYDKDGKAIDVVIKSPDELTPAQQAAIADISIFENVVKGTRRVAKVKLHNKNDALTALSKNLGLFAKDNKQRSTVDIKLDEVLSSLPPTIADAVKRKILDKTNNLDDIDKPKFLN